MECCNQSVTCAVTLHGVDFHAAPIRARRTAREAGQGGADRMGKQRLCLPGHLPPQTQWMEGSRGREERRRGPRSAEGKNTVCVWSVCVCGVCRVCVCGVCVRDTGTDTSCALSGVSSEQEKFSECHYTTVAIPSTAPLQCLRADTIQGVAG